MLRKKPSLILYFACVHKDTARYVLSYSKPFGLLPKDLALIGMVALQSRSIQMPKSASKSGKVVTNAVMQGKYNYMQYSLM